MITKFLFCDIFTITNKMILYTSTSLLVTRMHSFTYLYFAILGKQNFYNISDLLKIHQVPIHLIIIKFYFLNAFTHASYIASHYCSRTRKQVLLE